MSILIKGMEMPTSCISCLLNFGEKRPEYGLTIYCPYSDGVISWQDKAFDNGRLVSCGIVPVSPHGRLIDADAMTKCLADLLRFPSNLVNGQWIVNTIREQPTIIEAEERET